MTSITIAGARVLTPNGLVDQAVAVVDGMIQDLVNEPAHTDGAKLIDGSGLIVAPGFIDLQINGGFGFDLLDDPCSLWKIGQELPRHGVTSFLPTIITSPYSRQQAALRAIQRRPQGYVGAEPLGLHFEGPMVSAQHLGAHPIEHLQLPTSDVIKGWEPANGVVLVTIAPELEGAIGAISALVERGVVVAVGHTDATCDQATAAFEAGASMVTHLYNAMAPALHRAPNLVGATLTHDNMVASVIVDGIHLDPVTVQLAWNAKGPDLIVLISDAVAAMGQPPGSYRLGDQQVTSDGLSVRGSDGTLAGSTLTMDAAVRNLRAFANCDPIEAIGCATAVPARVIGASSRGVVRPGAIADLVALDQRLNVQLTICAGTVTHVADAAQHRVSAPIRETL